MFLTYFSTFSSIASLNVIISKFLTSLFKIENALAKQVISWVVPVLISVVGFVFGYGMFAEFGTISDPMGWVYTILCGLGMALVSNGIYDITFVKNALETIKEIVSTSKVNK